jgi:hypothetical protein
MQVAGENVAILEEGHFLSSDGRGNRFLQLGGTCVPNYIPGDNKSS